jgi:two-component system, LytTR family, sensor kinase
MEKFLKNRFVQHTLFWLFFISAMRADFKHEFQLTPSLIAKLLFSTFFLLNFILVYLNLLIFLPGLFMKKRYITYFAMNFAFVIVFNLTIYIVINQFQSVHDLHLGFRHWLFYNMSVSIIMLILSTFLHYIKLWSVMNEKNLKAEKEKVFAELEALKAQINPHLLFNTLNNLYSLSLEKSDKLPGLILKLSELMNYIIYECKSDRVPLQNEIEFVKSYIDLEKLRFEESVEIQSVFEIDNFSCSIAPLLLLPFIDNAFKHSHETGNKRIINIQLLTNENILTFEISNTCDPNQKKKEKSGIGINNVMKRLEYIYPGKHSVDINRIDNIFRVKLLLNMK